MNRRELMLSAGAAALLPVIAAEARVPRATVGSVPAFDAMLLLGSAQRGAGNHRWAAVTGGAVAGELQGRVQSGQLDWHVCPMSGATSVAVTCRIVRGDGAVTELRNRTLAVHAADFTRGSVLANLR